jgi:dTMP kinase
MSGAFIVFEGIDGVGKTTQVNRTCVYLRKLFGIERVERTKDLGGSELGEQLRGIMYNRVSPAEMAPGVLDLLFLAGHLQNWHTLVQPWLKEGKLVVSDRWWLSQFTYTAVRNFDPDVQNLYWRKKGDWPDLVVFLHGDPETLIARANARADAASHQLQKPWNDARKQAIVCERYFNMYQHLRGWCPILVTGKDEESVWTDVRAALFEMLKEKKLA